MFRRGHGYDFVMTFSGSFRNIPLKRLLFFAAVISAAMLAVVLVAQYGFGLHPCELCMAQRYPYAAVTAVGLASAFFITSKLGAG